MKSKIFSFKKMKEEAKLQLWIPLLLGFIMFVGHTLTTLISFEQWEIQNYRPEKYWILCENMWKNNLMNAGILFAVGAGILCGASSFFYLHDQKKVDFYHSLPVTRRNLFVERLVRNLLYFVIPYGAVLFLSVCACGLKGVFGLSFVGYALEGLLVHTIVFLCSYGMSALAVLLTGRLLLGVLGIGVFFSYGRLLGELLERYMCLFFDTYNIGYPSPAVTAFNNWAGPFQGGRSAVSALAEGQWLPILLYSCITGAILFLDLFLYERRPSQAAGHSMAFEKVGMVIKFFIQVPLILGLGVLFQMLVGMEITNKKGWFLFGLVVSCFLAHGIMEILYSMNVKRAGAHKLQFVYITAVAGILVSGFWFDWIHYDAYVPKEENLETIGLDFGAIDCQNFISAESLQKTKEKGYSYTSWSIPWVSVDSNSVLYGIISKIAKEERTQVEIGTADALKITTLNISYGTKSGRNVHRTYCMTKEECKAIVREVCGLQQFKEERYGNLEDKRSYLTGITLRLPEGELAVYQRDSEGRFALYDALCEDIKKADGSAYEEYPVGQMTLEYEIEAADEGMYKNQESITKVSVTDVVYLFPGYEKTLDILKKEELFTAIGELSIGRLIIYDQQGKEIICEDQEIIEKLKESLRYNEIWCSWLEYQEPAYVTVEILDEKGNPMETTLKTDLNILKELFPDREFYSPYG